MKKDKSNNLGFTLVELIVVIALMISLLVIAIVSFVNISDGKKEESWELVKDQIETAAIDFFGANEYLFEGQGNSDVEGYVTVSKLVSDDYLGRVVNPITNKVVNGCTYVQITRAAGSGSVDAVYKDEDISLVTDENGFSKKCDNSTGFASTTVAGAPKISVDILKADKKTVVDSTEGWLNYEKLGGSTLYVRVTPKDNSSISELTVNGTKITAESDGKYYYQETKEGEGLSANIVASNNGKSTNGSVNYNKDTVAPTFTINSVNSSNGKYATINNKKYSLNNNASISVTYKDGTSGVKSVTLNDTTETKNINSNGATQTFIRKLGSSLDGKDHPAQGYATDVAGNKSGDDDMSYLVYDDCSNSVTKTSYTTKCKNAGSRTQKTTYTDSYTGSSCKTATTKTVSCKPKGILLIIDNGCSSSDPDSCNNHPMTEHPGPTATSSKQGIFKDLNKTKGNTRPYSSSDRQSMDVVVGYTNTSGTQKSTSCSNGDPVYNCVENGTGFGISYAGSACENVGDYNRYFKFKVYWEDGSWTQQWRQITLSASNKSSTHAYFSETKTATIKDDDWIYRYGCSYSSAINIHSCGSSSGATPNVTTHKYILTIDGVNSNPVRLYTRYMADCGY